MFNGALMEMHRANPWNEVRDRVQGDIDLREVIENDQYQWGYHGTFTLAQGWQKWAIGKQPWKDSLKTMKRQGFEQKDYLKDFSVMIQHTTSMISLHQAELMILIWRSKEREFHQKCNLVQNPARKRNHNKKPSQRGFDGRLHDYE
jgi:hypothetical protein